MRTATFFFMGALGLACAHRPAEPAKTQATATEPQAEAQLSAGGGDPRLGELALTSKPHSEQAEVAEEAPAEKTSPAPRAIEPAAPTVATTPPGSALTPAEKESASKDEAELRERIQRALLRDKSLSFTAKRVRVEVERSDVTLLGEVRTAREKSEVEELVQRVSGVRRVSNRLAVIDQTPVAKTPDLSSSENQPAR